MMKITTLHTKSGKEFWRTINGNAQDKTVVEDAIELVIEGFSVRCFVSYSPSKIEVGGTYEVEFEMLLPDEKCVSASEYKKKQIERIDDGLSCDIYGYLDGDVFRSVVDFADQDIHYEYPHLNGHFIKVSADRIDVSF